MVSKVNVITAMDGSVVTSAVLTNDLLSHNVAYTVSSIKSINRATSHPPLRTRGSGYAVHTAELKRDREQSTYVGWL